MLFFVYIFFNTLYMYLLKKIIALFFGGIFAFLLASFDFGISYFFRIIPSSYSLFFILPIGALFFGFLSLVGNGSILYMFNERIGKIDFFNALILSVFSYFGFSLFSFSFYMIFSDYGYLMTSWDYWNFFCQIIASQSTVLTSKKFILPLHLSGGSSFNYFNAVLKFFVYILSGQFFMLVLYVMEKCKNCGGYLKEKHSKVVYFEEEESLQKFVKKVCQEKESTLDKVVGAEAEALEDVSKFKCEILLQKCRGCHRSFIILSSKEDRCFNDPSKSNWHEIDKKVMEIK